MPKFTKFILQTFAAAGLGWRRGVLRAQAEYDSQQCFSEGARDVLAGTELLADMKPITERVQ